MNARWTCFFVLAAAIGCGGSSDTGGSTDDSGAHHDSTSGGDTGSTTTDSGVGDSAKTDSGTKTDSTSGDSTSTDSSGTDTATGGDTATGTDTTVDDTGTTSTDTGTTTDTSGGHAIKTVFIIMMENNDWSSIKGSSSAPYINSLIGTSGPAAHAENYKTPPGNHPSEPNYLWLEAGDNLGITDDNDPSSNHQATTSHLVTQLEAAGKTWKSYQEDIDDTTCPLTSEGATSALGGYAPKHNPMVFFDDVTDTNSSTSAHCIAHMKNFTKLAGDLSAGTVADYNFITPELCHDMHGSGTSGPCNNIPFIGPDLIKMGDDWLSTNVPPILASSAYTSGGVLFIIWDEGGGTFGASDGPIGMIVLSPFAKAGHSNSTAYTHSSTLKTVEEIFGVPLIRDAATAGTTDLSDFFTTFP